MFFSYRLLGLFLHAILFFEIIELHKKHTIPSYLITRFVPGRCPQLWQRLQRVRGVRGDGCARTAPYRGQRRRFATVEEEGGCGGDENDNYEMLADERVIRPIYYIDL